MKMKFGVLNLARCWRGGSCRIHHHASHGPMAAFGFRRPRRSHAQRRASVQEKRLLTFVAADDTASHSQTKRNRRVRKSESEPFQHGRQPHEVFDEERTHHGHHGAGMSISTLCEIRRSIW